MRLADHRRVSSKAMPPEVVADDDRTVGRRGIGVACLKQSTDLRLELQYIEVVRRDAFTVGTDVKSVAGDLDAVGRPDRRHRLNRSACPLAEHFEIESARRPRDVHHLVWLWHRQRPKEHRVDRAEDGAAQSDADTKHEDDARDGQRCPRERPEAVLHVLFDRVANPT